MRIGRIVGIAVSASFIVLLVGLGGSLVTANAAASVGGQAEFVATGNNSFTVPSGVTKIRAFVYGAGGGAGATNSQGTGANGGSGAFGQGVIAVKAGEVLTIVVGAGGAGGQPGTSQNGQDGATTEILDSKMNVLVSAGGGGGGSCGGCSPYNVGSGGAAGTGPSGSLLHAGPDGSECGGGQTRCGYPLSDYSADVSIGGRGFNNGNEDDTETINGIQGYVYLEW